MPSTRSLADTPDEPRITGCSRGIGVPTALDGGYPLAELCRRPIGKLLLVALGTLEPHAAHRDGQPGILTTDHWAHDAKEASMDEDAFNSSIRKFLKKVGVTAQREIEKAVRDAVSHGRMKGDEKLPAKMVLTLGGVDLSLAIHGEIELE